MTSTFPSSLASSSSPSRSSSAQQRRIFVTVGSTRFDKLVAAVSSESFLRLLSSLHYTQLTIQHGQSPKPAEEGDHHHHHQRIQLTSYQYKPSLREDMEQADLIISHAGAGSILESLRLHKPLVVVVNEDLMDNHQQELGNALHDQGHLVCTSIAALQDALKAKEYEKLVPFPDPDPTRFSSFLDAKLGLV